MKNLKCHARAIAWYSSSSVWNSWYILNYDYKNVRKVCKHLQGNVYCIRVRCKYFPLVCWNTRDCRRSYNGKASTVIMTCVKEWRYGWTDGWINGRIMHVTVLMYIYIYTCRGVNYSLDKPILGWTHRFWMFLGYAIAKGWVNSSSYCSEYYSFSHWFEKMGVLVWIHMINFSADLESVKTKCANPLGWGCVC